MQKERQRPYTVYALIDPQTSACRYVGLTRKGLKARLKTHRADTKHAEKHDWIQSLAREGLSPIITVLETLDTSDYHHALQTEYQWQLFYLERGARLLNRRIGTRHTDESRAKISLKLRGNTNGRGNNGLMRKAPVTAETRAKLSKARQNRVITAETRARTSAGLRAYHAEKRAKYRAETWQSWRYADNTKAQFIIVGRDESRCKLVESVTGRPRRFVIATGYLDNGDYAEWRFCFDSIFWHWEHWRIVKAHAQNYLTDDLQVRVVRHADGSAKRDLYDDFIGVFGGEHPTPKRLQSERVKLWAYQNGLRIEAVTSLRVPFEPNDIMPMIYTLANYFELHKQKMIEGTA